MRKLFLGMLAPGYLAMGLLAMALLGLAQDQAPPPGSPDAQGDPGADPPGRAARLSYMSGTVSFQPGGVDDWVPAEMNRPLTTGDRVWTEDGARAELHLGSAAFRLNGRTNFAFLNLDDHAAQVQLSLGTLNIRLRRLNEDETFEIDTPQVAFTLLRPGDYRVEVSEQGDATILTVHGGDGEATAAGQAFPIHAREQVRISGGADGSQPAFDRRQAPISDQFDLFCQGRDRAEDFSPSAKYVSRDMPGYSDLDANGSWRTDPTYGSVWVPSAVAVGWSPYHFGHWVWIAPWGWTWVDDAPWGYAPFHYGRWVFIGGGWGWVPGPVVVRPVYAPAMVAWVGGGGFAASLSIGGGVAVGWFPLGPREVWVPSYRVSAVYMTRVNVTNTVVTEVAVRGVYASGGVGVVYANQRIAGAVVAVPGAALVAGRPIAAVAVRVPPAAVVNVAVIHGAPVVPERAAVLGGRPVLAGAHIPPAAVMNRPVVARMAPPPPPAAFARQQEVLRANQGRAYDPGAFRSTPANAAAAHPYVRPASPSGFANNSGGARNFSPQNTTPSGGNAPANNAGQPRNFNRPSVNNPGNTTQSQPPTRPAPAAQPPSTPATAPHNPPATNNSTSPSSTTQSREPRSDQNREQHTQKQKSEAKKTEKRTEKEKEK